ncbi:MAG: hypothetical protein Q9222_004051 [Ikaeria aurantiellina]
MSAKDVASYKRIVQYFWDPEPKNNDPARPPIWCLGRCYHSYKSNSSPRESESKKVSVPEQDYHAKEYRGDERSDAEGHKKATTPQTECRQDDGTWPSDFLDDFESRIWFTYRSGFSIIQRSDEANAKNSMTFAVRLRSQLIDQGGFSSDTGWGCMIRSGQSLFANALFILRLGRGTIAPLLSCTRGTANNTVDWRRGTQQDEERELLSLFADHPNAPFSIHRFVEHGASACGKHPGQWFGPSAAARCIQALTHCSDATDLQVYINGDGADVYEDRFLSLATAKEGRFTPTLILVGIRLGIDRVTPVYWEALKASLQLSQSVGIAGGRPSSSHYFVGYQGNNFFFLDPHQTRPAFPLRSDVTEYNKDDIDSCHTRRLRRLPIQEMDPSMLLGFLIRDREDWQQWRRSMANVAGKPLVHVADKEPVITGHSTERQSAVDEVQTLDDDEDDDNDGEMVEHP